MSFFSVFKARDYDLDLAFEVAGDGIFKTLITGGNLEDSVVRGEVFNYANFSTLGNAEELDFVFTTSASNFVFFASSLNTTGSTTVELYENPTLGAAGTARTPFNFNRNSSTVAQVTIDEGQTISAVGTLLTRSSIGQAGSGNTTVGGAAGGGGMVLKLDEDYLLRITSLAASNVVSYSFLWSEVTPRV